MTIINNTMSKYVENILILQHYMRITFNHCPDDVIYNIVRLSIPKRKAKCKYNTTVIWEDGTVFTYGHINNIWVGKSNISIKLCTNVKKISCGKEFIIILSNLGLFSCGVNDWGQLGIGYANNVKRRELQEINISHVTKIASGYYHTLVLCRSNVLYSFGCNESGQLGLGDKISRHSPCIVMITDVIKIDCDYSNSTVLTKDSVYVWGNGCVSPIMLNLQNVLTFSCTNQSTIFLDKLGQLYMSTYDHVLIKIYFSVMPHMKFIRYINGGSSFVNMLTNCTNVHILELSNLTRYDKFLDVELIRTFDLPNIKTISGGSDHTIYIDIYGNVYGHGDNRDDQLIDAKYGYCKYPHKISL